MLVNQIISSFLLGTNIIAIAETTPAITNV